MEKENDLSGNIIMGFLLMISGISIGIVAFTNESIQEFS